MLAGAELEGLALATVPRLGQAGLSEHVTLIYVMHGLVGDLRLDSTCPPSNKPPLPPPSLCVSWTQCPPNVGGSKGIGGGFKGWKMKSAAPGH